jgi:hypothetical protein
LFWKLVLPFHRRSTRVSNKSSRKHQKTDEPQSQAHIFDICRSV